MPRERAEYLSVTTDAITGKPRTFRGKLHRDRSGFGHFVRVEWKGKVYHLGLVNHYDSLYQPEKGWRTFGEPYESRRASSAKRAATRGKMAAWEQKALDDAVLKVVREYGTRGATAVLVALDLFNWLFQFTNGLAEQYSAGDDVKLTDAADRLHWSKPSQKSAVASALARLVKRGKVVSVYGSGLRGGEARLFVAKEFDQ